MGQLWQRDLQKEDNVKFKLEQPIVIENEENGSVPEKEKTPKVPAKLSTALAPYSISVIIFALILYFLVYPFLFPNPTRVVDLKKTGDGFGVFGEKWYLPHFGVEWDRNSFSMLTRGWEITQVTPRGPADLKGIQSGDTVVGYHGVRDNVLSISVRAKCNISWRRICFSVGVSLIFNLLIFTIDRNTKKRGPERLVTISRTQGGFGSPYGFKIEYGRISDLIPGGAADLQGQLNNGDSVVRINGVKIAGFPSESIKELMETRDNDIKLVVRSYE